MNALVRQFQTFESTPEYAPLRAALATNLWPPVETELHRMPPEHAGYALFLLGQVDGIEAFLQYAADNHPRSPYARTALASRFAMLGWKERESAPSLDPTQPSLFQQWMNTAEQWLIAVCAEYPDFAPAWSFRVLTARALPVGESEARRRYRRLADLSPNDYPSQAQMLQYFLPNWMGSTELALAFARECARDAPLGSNSPAVIALCHIEHWYSIGRGKPGRAYMGSPAVHNELMEAAQRSVLHPSHRLDPIGVEARSAFAMAFYAGGHFADAAVQLQSLGDRATSFPWYYEADTVDDLNRVYQTILSSAARGRR